MDASGTWESSSTLSGGVGGEYPTLSYWILLGAGVVWVAGMWEIYSWYLTWMTGVI